eukprot:9504169-Pyramimonas_sp.AAC.4
MVFRVWVFFLAEDPFMFARRVAEASQLRDWVESMLRYNFLIDSMPTDDLPGLTSEQVHRITEYALNTKRLQDKLMGVSTLLREVTPRLNNPSDARSHPSDT